MNENLLGELFRVICEICLSQWVTELCGQSRRATLRKIIAYLSHDVQMYFTIIICRSM